MTEDELIEAMARAIAPPEWLVEAVARAIFEARPDDKSRLERSYEDFVIDARIVLAEIAKHGKLVAREPAEEMLKDVDEPWRERDAQIMRSLWDAAPQWSEEKK